MSEAKPDNLRLWKRHADIDPKFTKAITGKAYKGTSPNPQYVIQCLTDLFGPVGEGFGWDVVAEDFTPLGPEVLHWCRIRFWHTHRGNTYDSYGQTKAAYTAGSGKVIVDEDAPKKSLTDAIIKAASHIGIAANIFLGRWDDQKYVQQVAAEHAKADAPKFDAVAAEKRIVASIAKKANEDDLTDLWRAEAATVDDIGGEGKERIIAAFKARKAALQKPPADDLGGDYIPYEGK